LKRWEPAPVDTDRAPITQSNIREEHVDEGIYDYDNKNRVPSVAVMKIMQNTSGRQTASVPGKAKITLSVPT
jgi:hypothetical protein